jgi:hypothetical protein
MFLRICAFQIFVLVVSQWEYYYEVSVKAHGTVLLKTVSYFSYIDWIANLYCEKLKKKIDLSVKIGCLQNKKF